MQIESRVSCVFFLLGIIYFHWFCWNIFVFRCLFGVFFPEALLANETDLPTEQGEGIAKSRHLSGRKKSGSGEANENRRRGGRRIVWPRPAAVKSEPAHFLL